MDYRHLNAVTQNDVFPILRTQDHIVLMPGTALFSTRTEYATVPVTYQRLMELGFAGLQRSLHFIYLSYV